MITQEDWASPEAQIEDEGGGGADVECGTDRMSTVMN